MRKLRKPVDIGTSPEPKEGTKQLIELLEELNDVFSIENGERGETD